MIKRHQREKRCKEGQREQQDIASLVVVLTMYWQHVSCWTDVYSLEGAANHIAGCCPDVSASLWVTCFTKNNTGDSG